MGVPGCGPSVACTILANDVEVGTVSARPADLEALAVGFLFSGGCARGAGFSVYSHPERILAE